ncbi:hypothetical protein Goshw_029752 [Gossypium schwendimanii]|uniref:Uncharacterized protein n=1 Tax=Gossypium schwendimanii TaxID=34291 RepID=A0A7J9NB73_GOSSC|nr:hypothetical protein [Gossypium schwendimanii]
MKHQNGHLKIRHGGDVTCGAAWRWQEVRG